MSYKEGDEIHIEDDEATAGSKEGVVRWVLLISLLAAILILSVIWIAGAWQSDNSEPYASPVEESDGAGLNDDLSNEVLTDEDQDFTEIESTEPE
ncbi:MAG: hypothetical protein JY451_02690 [Erythrobacter sp.]|nr:MAG: hypothetical protein JY451_02690 [Erythrobacter sp.]